MRGRRVHVEEDAAVGGKTRRSLIRNGKDDVGYSVTLARDREPMCAAGACWRNRGLCGVRLREGHVGQIAGGRTSFSIDKPLEVQRLPVRIAAAACIQNNGIAHFSVEDDGLASLLAVHLNDRVVV